MRRIRQGEWREGDRLPGLNELEKLYPQSRMTLYKALRHLADRGHLAISRGRGTFVAAAHVRQRVGILASSALVNLSAAPFAFQAFRHAHAYFSRCGMDSQLYAEDPLTPTGLPTGLHQELKQKRLAGLLTIDASFPCRYMLSSEWRLQAVPHVHVGAILAPYRVYVDRLAFLDEAVDLACRQGRQRLALLERQEHIVEHWEHFCERCHARGLTPYASPSAWPPGELPFEDYGYELMLRVAGGADRPDAVIIPDDVIAKGIAQGALALGIRVPQDLLLIAMTNRGARFFYPVPVVSIEVDVEAIVATAAGLLIDLMNGAARLPQIILVPPVVASPPADRLPAGRLAGRAGPVPLPGPAAEPPLGAVGRGVRPVERAHKPITIAKEGRA